MSLNAAAQHLAAHGRGTDNTLVHMSHREVKGLQDIARAHGGSLSINPHTGLPEAGFLESILPMVAGAVLGPGGMGLFESAGMAGLGVGALTGMATGSLSKGLMAGLGAYGGAGLMGGLMGAGEGALAAKGIQAAGMPQFTGDTAAYAQQVNALRDAELAKAAQSPFMDRASAGFSQIGEAPGQFFKDNWKYAAAAAPGIIQAIEPTTKQPEIKTDTTPNPKYTYSAGRVSPTPTPDPYGREQTYFKPMFTQVYAGGGPIEAMSNANAIGANTGYPMADISKGAYATPWQTPISRNVIADTSDTGVNPMTGEMNFADGGVTTTTPMPESYTYDPQTQTYKKIETPKVELPPAPTITPARGNAPIMSDAAFAAQQAQGAKNAESLGNLGSTVSEGIMGLLTQAPISVQIARSILGAMGFGGPSGVSPGAPGTGIGYGGTAASGMSGLGFTAGAPSGQSAANSGSGEGGMNAGGGGRGGLGDGGGDGGGIGIGGGEGVGFGGGWAHGGGISSHLGDYSDGGRLLRGPGDGVSDSIPAMIGKKQPARLADGEFVVPARIVSELGNGSTEAGARKLYAMMDRVQKARGQTVGKGKVAKNSRADKYLPA